VSPVAGCEDRQRDRWQRDTWLQAGDDVLILARPDVRENWLRPSKGAPLSDRQR
jgi:hypothetical protein